MRPDNSNRENNSRYSQSEQTGTDKAKNYIHQHKKLHGFGIDSCSFFYSSKEKFIHSLAKSLPLHSF